MTMNTFNRFAKQFARKLLILLGVWLYKAGLARWIINGSTRTRVVLYHDVNIRRSSYTMGLGTCVSPETFALHLDYYQRYYCVKRMRDYLAEIPGSCAVAGVLITFDDGYASFMEHALPLLESRNMSATVYLIGNAVRGQMVWVNRVNQAMHDHPGQMREILSAYPNLARLSRRGVIHRIQKTFSPSQIRDLIKTLECTIPDLTRDHEKLFASSDDVLQMQRRGVEFGFHTNDHWNLSQCRDSELDSTLSIHGIEQLINSDTFAYPFGYFSRAALGRLQRQGYQKLLTVGSSSRASPLHLDRVEVNEQSFARIFARLEIEEPIVHWIRQWRHGSRKQAKERTLTNQRIAS